ncbi:transposase [Desulfovibrio sp. JC010]|uniref:transposase n=1 Tax=Desulfovibrio sp. JC010 TaxID=2593641 RepID=UPI0013D17F13|nr:transposase [Desulfovibrio sp. JC010]NDV27867.1 hypothetical protein [Desulfovibrio sp. JC010]
MPGVQILLLRPVNSKAYSINCCKPFFVGNRPGDLFNFWGSWGGGAGAGYFWDREPGLATCPDHDTSDRNNFMQEYIRKYCNTIRNRSQENKTAFIALTKLPSIPVSPCISLLRQELDSMVRTIYLCNLDNNQQIQELLSQMFRGEQWHLISAKGKKQMIRDREMVDIATNLHGWTEYVYKFGCSFIHLSNFHQYNSSDPLINLCQTDIDNIENYIQQYHGPCHSGKLNFDSIIQILPQIFDKINANLQYDIEDFEKKYPVK